MKRFMTFRNNLKRREITLDFYVRYHMPSCSAWLLFFVVLSSVVFFFWFFSYENFVPLSLKQKTKQTFEFAQRELKAEGGRRLSGWWLIRFIPKGLVKYCWLLKQNEIRSFTFCVKIIHCFNENHLIQNSKFLFQFKYISILYSEIQNCMVPLSAAIMKCLSANRKWIW